MNYKADRIKGGTANKYSKDGQILRDAAEEMRRNLERARNDEVSAHKAQPQRFGVSNYSKGYTLDELKEQIKHSRDTETSLDDLFGDEAIAPDVIGDLVKAIEGLKAAR